MPAIDIDRDAAHEAAQRELAKPIYPKASLTERLSDWLDELLYRIVQEGSSVPGGWFTISVLLIMLAVAVVVAVRIARRTMRTNRGGDMPLFDSQELSAAQHRATAEQYAAAGQLGRRHPPSAESGRPPARGRRGAQSGAGPDRDRARQATPVQRYQIWPANYCEPQTLSTTSPMVSGPAPSPPTG